MKNEKLFKTDPTVSFRQYLSENMASDNLNEALEIAKKNGYKVVNEGAFTKFITGAALSLGLISNAMAADFNAQPTSGNYSSKITTTEFNRQLQKDFNMESDVQLTDKMIWNIADIVSSNLTARMDKEHKYDEEDLIKMPEWKNAVEFYKIVAKKDPSLANMFSRRLDKALTKSLSIAPNLQQYAM